MSSISIYMENKPEEPLEQSHDRARIARVLGDLGVRFEQWEASKVIEKDASQEDILEAYKDSVDALVKDCGFQSVDVIHMNADHPQKTAFRSKFLQEHTHSEDEVRFFVEGSGLFTMHVEDKVYGVLCEKGDLISVPANTRHWFDMGCQPEFTAIRFFNNPEGWVARYTGAVIAESFPRMSFNASVILTDIEGTIASISFVKDVLFPYARKNIPSFVASHGDHAGVADILARVGEEIGNTDVDCVVQELLKWIDEDRKATALKELQGLVWEDGYRQGHFTAHFYEDAYARLKAWQDESVPLYVYSSGSVKAQELMFEHTVYGDVRYLFKGYYDTKTGPKKEAASYEAIARDIGCEPGSILFLSDVVEELDAAREAGMSTALLARDSQPGEVDHDCFTCFQTITLS